MSTEDSHIDAATEAAIIDICDRLCLNNDLYNQYLNDATSVIERFITDARIRTTIQPEISKRLDAARLKSHWQNSIACACRDVAYVIPD